MFDRSIFRFDRIDLIRNIKNCDIRKTFFKCKMSNFLAQPSWNGTHRIVGYQRQRKNTSMLPSKIDQMKVSSDRK